MRSFFIYIFLFIGLCGFTQNKVSIHFFPPAGIWHLPPPFQYFDTAKLSAAIAFARDKASRSPSDLLKSNKLSFGKETFGFAIGPFADRGDQSYDMARFGLFTLHKGNWGGKQLLSKQWFRNALTPTKAPPFYGFMNFFLNTDKKYLPSAPESAFMHIDNGTNIIYLDPQHEPVIVSRWIQDKEINTMVKMVLEALKTK